MHLSLRCSALESRTTSWPHRTAPLRSGKVSVNNSGGFASVRCRNFEPALDAGAYDGVELRLKVGWGGWGGWGSWDGRLQPPSCACVLPTGCGARSGSSRDRPCRPRPRTRRRALGFSGF
jgi:hypothetical protein